MALMIFALPIILFFAYLSLLIRMIATDAVWRVPGFACYLVAFLACLIAHTAALAHPPGLGWLPYIEPALIAMKLVAWLEAFSLATARLAIIERRLMLTLLATMAALAGVVTYGLQPDLYRAVRMHANVALAIASLAGVGWIWIAPIDIRADVRRHCLILTVYVCNLAVAGLLPAGTGAAWRFTNLLYSVVSLLCCWEWWRYGVKRSLVLSTSSMSDNRLSRAASR